MIKLETEVFFAVKSDLDDREKLKMVIEALLVNDLISESVFESLREDLEKTP